MEKRKTITYGDLSKEFGNVLPRSWGTPLTEIASRLKTKGLPLLPVIVVSHETGLPSINAKIYKASGISNDLEMRAEQQRCFAHDWTKSELIRAPQK